MQIMPVFGNLAFTLVAFVLALSVIVAIHEYGHYIVGRWCGIKAEVFSVGMGPVIFSRQDRHGTAWQIAALPIGGYVRFLGDSNAASVGDAGAGPGIDPRQTMAGAPLWARSATVAAGPVFNFIFAIAIFAGTIMGEGRAVTPLTFGELRPFPAGGVNELRPGDQMVSVAGHPFDDPALSADLRDLIPLTETLTYQIRRDGRLMSVVGPYYFPPAVTSVAPRSAADDAGLRIDDVITAIDGQPIFAFPQLQDAVEAAAGQSLRLSIWRDGTMFERVIAPRRVDVPLPEGGFETRWLMGVTGTIFFTPAVENVAPWTAISMGADALWRTMTTSLSALKHVILGQISTCNFSGPVGIAKTSGSMAEQGAQSFIWFIGALSAAVGLINLFPIPVLDGGHLVFYGYEAITRRKPSERAMQVFLFLGLSLILSLMIFTILNDTILCP